MPYKDPEQKRVNAARYRAEHRAALAEKERERQARHKEADPEGFRAKTIARNRAFRREASEASREKMRAHRRRHWAKVKDDPEVKRANAARVKAWYLENSDRAKANSLRARRAKVATDLQCRLGIALRRRLHLALRRKHHGSSAVRDLGCSLPELIAHLERQFRPGMSWDNWGRKGWHIDHIKPLRSFDLTDPEQYRNACHYTNLQPLWARENIGKGARQAFVLPGREGL